MSLSKPNLRDVVINQFIYKIKGHGSIITAMITVQIIAMFFTINSGVAQRGSTFYDMAFVSGDLIFVFTCIWFFVISLTFDSKSITHTYDSFVTNHLTRFLSNIAYLIYLALVGAVSTIFGGFFVKVLTIWFYNDVQVFVLSGYGPVEILSAILLTFLYLLLISSIGYFLGQFFKINKLLRTIIVIGMLALFFTNQSLGLLTVTFNFFIKENILYIFIFKALIVSCAFYVLTWIVSNRMEA